MAVEQGSGTVDVIAVRDLLQAVRRLDYRAIHKFRVRLLKRAVLDETSDSRILVHVEESCCSLRDPAYLTHTIELLEGLKRGIFLTLNEKVFGVAAESSTYEQAARALELPMRQFRQSLLSLEREHGRLFVHEPGWDNPVQLTEAGGALLARLQPTLVQWAEVRLAEQSRARLLRNAP